MPPPSANRPAFPSPDAIELGDDFTVFIHRDSPDWTVGKDEEETNVLFACGENLDGQCGRTVQYHQQTWRQKCPQC